MPALVPSFLFDFESEMQVITEAEFARMTLSTNMWWQKVTRKRSTGKKREILSWLLSTAQIRSTGKGGNLHFADMAAKYQEYDILNAGEGLKLTRDQVEDNDGNGFDFAAEWSAQMGAYMAYWPQKSVATLILGGEGTTFGAAYDGLPFFSGIGAPHPVNPFKTSAGSYANLFTGASSGLYPGALPIDTSVSVDQAVANLQAAIAYIASIKMPNGVDPRFLKPKYLMVPPSLTARAQQLTNARYIAQLAAAGVAAGGSGDVEALIKNWGLGEPIEVMEFATSTASDATSWYLATEQIEQTQLGGLVYVDREPFKITYYTGAGGGTGVDAILDRARELEWHVQGRNVAGYGHPYALFKAKAT